MTLDQDRENLRRELDTLGRIFAKELKLAQILRWLDRQLQRSPRLYAWLSR